MGRDFSFRQKRVALGISVAILLSVAAMVRDVAAEPPRKVIRVVFRCDDYSTQSDTALELKLLDVFRRHHAPITLAVIPYVSDHPLNRPGEPEGNLYPLTKEKADILKSAVAEKLVEVAQHGYSHHSRLSSPLSEFADLAADEQRQRIVAGRQLLKEAVGTDITIFIPPYNSYDVETLRILEAEGFTILSAAQLGPVRPGKLAYIPETVDPKGIQRAVADARAAADPSPVIVVHFHNYDLRENTKAAMQHPYLMSLAELDQLVAWTVAQPDVEAVTFSEVARSVKSLNADYMKWWANLSSRMRFLPRRMTDSFKRVLFSTAGEVAVNHRVKMSLATFWAAIVSMVGMIGYLAGRSPLWRGRRWRMCGLVVGLQIVYLGLAVLTPSGLAFKLTLTAVCLGGIAVACHRGGKAAERCARQVGLAR